MLPAEARAMYRQMLAVWPNGTSQTDDAVAAFVDYLSGLELDTAHKMLRSLRLSAKRFPSMAECEDALRPIRESMRYLRALPTPSEASKKTPWWINEARQILATKHPGRAGECG